LKPIFFILSICIAASFQTVAQTANPQQYKYVFTVAKDGTGDYYNIQDAIDAMRVYPLASITLYIKNGVYNEKIELPANNTDVTFIGENVDSTIITWNDYSGKGKHTTFTSYTAKISGNRFRAENITFANNPFNYTHFEEQFVNNPKDKIIIDYGIKFPQSLHTKDPSLKQMRVATYTLDYGKGKVIMLGLTGHKLANSESFLRFFDDFIINQALSQVPKR